MPPVKTVNGGSRAVISAGSPINYTISFRNSGDTPARRVAVTDDLPAELEYLANSLRLDNQILTDAQDADEGSVQGRQIIVRLAEVSPGQIVHVMFQARFGGNTPAAAGIVNVARLAAENVPAINSSAALVVVDPFGTVFSGRGGAAAPIGGARVEILLNSSGGAPLQISPGVGFPPNLENVNPYSTDALGHYSFALLPEQLGSQGSPARYFMRVTAPGYIPRMLELTVSPGANGLFAISVRALDGQPLARAGGFDLVRQDVTIDDIAAIALNIPMFEPTGLELTKAADRPRAEIGEAVAYRLEVNNPTASPVADLVVRDRLPTSFHYVAGTGRCSVGAAPEQSLEPELNGEELIFRIGTLGPGATARLIYRVRVGANAREGEQQNVAVAAAVFPSGERSQSPEARASVTIGSGIFSTRQIIVGRVFADMNGSGKFDDGDKPLSGVRLYLNSGQSVLTDFEGLYNLPAVSDGAQVLSLDPITLPSGYLLADDGTLAGRSWTRLLRTPLGGGAMLRQNFTLVPGPNAQPASDPTAKAVHPGTPDPAAPNSPDSREASEPTVRASQPANSPDETGMVKVSWQKRPRVSRYRIQVASDISFQDVVFDGRVIGNQYVPEMLEPGRYYWRVASADAEAGKFSRPEQFEIKAVATAAEESVEPVMPGEIRVLRPQANEVIMSPAMQLDARVALNWTVALEVNGRPVGGKSIGTTRQDPGNKVTTYTYVGIELRPGSNRVRATPVSPEGVAGRAAEFKITGRGPVRRLEILSDKKEIQANRRDSTTVTVRAFDQWGNPAADEQVSLETSAGELSPLDEPTGAGESSTPRQSLSSLADTSPLEPHKGEASQVVLSLSGGEARARLVSAGMPGEAQLKAVTGQSEATAKVRFTPESRPAILVGLAEMTLGSSLPELNRRGDTGHVRGRFSFFYSGRLGKKSLLTLAYDSERPINRTAGRDRLFQLDSLERVYPLFGDSSIRQESAQSNSKLYARLDHDRSYAQFGDFEADMADLPLISYSRKLTGVKLHLENADGDFLTVTGARPDTAFARDVFAGGGLGLLRLSYAEILPGSETVVLETRDRRNPELIIARERLVRSVDYNLNPATGEFFFLRYISTFDSALNLMQLVVTYEHRASSLSSAVYTARARKNINAIGLQLDVAGVLQRQDNTGSFILGGLALEKRLPSKGALRFAFATSQGEILGSGNFFDGGDGRHDGNAYLLELNQPLSFYQGTVRARYSYTSAGFFNPFGGTVTPGSRRVEASLELRPQTNSTLHFGITDERNRTATVDNSRLTFSAGWDQIVAERFRFHLGYDHRSLSDERSDRSTESNLLTAAADVKVTDKLQVSAKREQNLGEADPTYPDQTTLAATYQINQWSKVFLTQRLASAAIMPIADFSGGGFTSTGARRETALGIETRFGKYTSMTGRYQLENGINGTDSFAVIGLQNRLPLTQQFSLELGFERGFHVAGEGQSFNSATVGFGWQPTSDFRASGRYEFRDRAGVGQIISLGAAGRLSDGITALSRFQFARTGFDGSKGLSLDGTAALAIRPLTTDRAGLLFSYSHRSLTQQARDALSGDSRDQLDSISSDGYYQATRALELYGRFALLFFANGQPGLPYVSTLTYLTQGRTQYRLTRRFDWAGEFRFLMQPASRTRRVSYGAELGFWLLPDLRSGGGYNFTRAGEPDEIRFLPVRRGFYFNISSKLSNLFDLFGTDKEGLAPSEPSGAAPKTQP
ncbi:MAG TPA: hypothetical protein VJ124_12615 [Pyrinomonadaceae bacterium]|nr:hypothetical protein [Pyrinomonadaceae bacterium]